MIQFILLATVIGILLFAMFVLNSGYDSKEPPVAPECMPVIGHVRGLMSEKNDFYPRISKICSAPIFTIRVPGQKMYVVTSPKLVSKVQKMKTILLSFEPMKVEYAKVLYGLSTETVQILQNNMLLENGNWGMSVDLAHSYRVGLRQGDELAGMNKVMLQSVVDHLDAHEPAKGTGTTVDLYEFLRQAFTSASTNSIFGPKNPFNDAVINDAFWVFESKMMPLLLSPMPYVFARSAMKARETVAEALRDYFANGGLDSAPMFTKIRHQAWKKNGISDTDVALVEIGTAISALINTVPASFWMLTYIFSDPGLLALVREEIDTTTSVTQDKGPITRTIDVTRIKNECPLLVSTFQETLRFTTAGSSARKVLQDTMLDGEWLLKKDSMVLLSNRSIHFDERNYGQDAKAFNPRRFIKGEKQQTTNGKLPSDVCFRAFGGGHQLCPGRHFATNEILAVCALFLARYDIAPANGAELKLPTSFNTNLVAPTMRPDNDIKVNLRQRVGYEDAVWRMVLSPADKPFTMVAEDRADSNSGEDEKKM